jgi:hypothetical protein
MKSFISTIATAIAERNDAVIRYGLVEPQLSNNPFKILFSQWVYLRDVVQSKNFLTAFKYLVKPTGWSPHGCGTSTEDLKQSLRLEISDRSRLDPLNKTIQAAITTWWPK